MVGFNDRSTGRLAGVDPRLLEILDRARKLSGVNFEISEGMRDPARQAELVRSGASQTQNSRHLTGNATDIFIPDGNGGVNWDFEAYRPIADAAKIAAKELGYDDFQWGGDWESLRDGVHFQVGRSGDAQGRVSTRGTVTQEGQEVGDAAMAALGFPSNQGAGSVMQEEQQPQGLLGTLGIQKMQEGAAGETGQRFYERDTFKDTAATLAEAFAGLGNNPALQKAAAGIANQRTEAKARNKTVEYLRANGRGDLADMIEQGMISGKDAAGVMLAKPEDTKGVAVGDRIVNPVTGEVIYEGEPTVDQDAILSARKEFTSLPVVKAFTTQTTAYGRVISSAEDPSPAGDLALIFNYMKVLDPGSTVREGEFATAQESGSVDDRTRGLYNKIVSGERLSDQQRADFADRATRLYSGAEQQYNDISGQYSAFAAAAGLPPEQVIPNFGFSGTRYQKPPSLTPPPAPTGVDPAAWAAAWAEMTDEERATY